MKNISRQYFYLRAGILLFALYIVMSYSACNSTGPDNDDGHNADSINVVIHNWKICDMSNSGLPSNSITKIVVDRDNHLWIGTFSSGLVKYQGGSWTTYTTHNSQLPSDSIRSLAIDMDNTVWVGTNNGLAHFNGTSWTIYNTTNTPLPYRVISALAFDHNNVLWVGCGYATFGGLLTLDKKIWTLYTPRNSMLPSSIIQTIHIDKNNAKWIGTGTDIIPYGTGGVVKIINNQWSVYSKDNSGMLYYSANAIVTDLDGNVWIGDKAWLYFGYNYYDGALLKFDGNVWSDYRANPRGIWNPKAIVSNRVDEIACDKYGYLWIATEPSWKFPNNLSVFKEGIWKNVTDIDSTFPRPVIRDIQIDNNGIIWLATTTGVMSISYSLK